MRTKLDYVKKQIDAGLFEVGAVIDVALNKRSWVPFMEHQKNIASLAERVDGIMDQQKIVEYMVCISGDFRQIGVLVTLPQTRDLVHTGGDLQTPVRRKSKCCRRVATANPQQPGRD